MPFFFLPLVFWLSLIGGGFYLAYRAVRALENRSGSSAEIEALGTRLSRVEDALESMDTRLRQLDEAQQFTTRLLTEKGTPSPPDTGDS